MTSPHLPSLRDARLQQSRIFDALRDLRTLQFGAALAAVACVTFGVRSWLDHGRTDAILEVTEKRLDGEVQAIGTLGRGLLYLDRDVRNGMPREATLDEIARAAAIVQASRSTAQRDLTYLPPALSQSIERRDAEATALWRAVGASILLLRDKSQQFNAVQAAECADIARLRLPAMRDLVVESRERVSVSRENARESYERLQLIYLALGVSACVALPLLILAERNRRAAIETARQRAEFDALNAELARKTHHFATLLRENDLILACAPDGLFLLEPGGIVGSQHSARLPEILGAETPAGRNLAELLAPMLTPEMRRATTGHLSALFDMNRSEKQVAANDPYARLEVCRPLATGGSETGVLCFTFKRVVHENSVVRVFGTVQDRTEHSDLAARAAAAERRADKLLTRVTELCAADDDHLCPFLDLLDRELGTLAGELEGRDSAAPGELRPLLHSTHNIKGNALVLGFQSIAEPLERVEDMLMPLCSHGSSTSAVFAALRDLVAEIRTDVAEIRALRSHLRGEPAGSQGTGNTVESHAQRRSLTPSSAGHEIDLLGSLERNVPHPLVAVAEPVEPVEELAHHIGAFAHELAAKRGCAVEVEVDDAALADFSTGRTDLVRDVLIQLVRNTLAHGIESAYERAAFGKPATGLIRISRAAPLDGMCGITFHDDGRGLDIAQLRARALELGLLSEGEAATTDDATLASLIFRPGFTTLPDAGPDAGRGVGLDLVRTRIVDEAGGEVGLAFDPGHFCEFTLHLPTLP